MELKKIVVLLTILTSSTLVRSEETVSSNLAIDVFGERPNNQDITSPAKVLYGDELKNKLDSNLGATLTNELGFSSTGFGAGASRPVIRGLNGPRIQILENGMTVNDVSNISADHAVADSIQNASQIEILRGASSLMYGSGSSGGLINVLNDRIATTLPEGPTGGFSTSYGTGANTRSGSGFVDTALGNIALHVDVSKMNADNYSIPGYAELGGPNANWAITKAGPNNITYRDTLPFSYNNQDNIGVGASYIGSYGYTGFSYEHLNHNYGIPSADGGYIQQSQDRYDFVNEIRNPLNGFSNLKISLSHSQYNHNEFNSDGTPATIWNNKADELRAVLTHQTWNNWTGLFGLQMSIAKLNALDVATNASAIVPETTTNSQALFWVEEAKFGDFKTSIGVRYNLVNHNPNASSSYAGADDVSFIGGTFDSPKLESRSFNLLSYSLGETWAFSSGYLLGGTYTVAQRAPSATELYGYGPHDATSTFLVGNSNLSTETSRNMEVSLQKNLGKFQAQANVYINQIQNYVYGANNGSYDTASTYLVEQTSQANATVKGVETQVTYNWMKNGLGGRLFGDSSRGTFDTGGNLPLQPAPRVGIELSQKTDTWLYNMVLIHAYEQNNIADFENAPTPSYNLLNAGVSYSKKVDKIYLTFFAKATNLLNQDIRYSTTPETIRLYAPQMGRNFIVGLKGLF
jgi:iron complex outermembrane recepter protein